MQRFLILFVFGFFMMNSLQAQQDLEVEFSAAQSVAPGGTVTIDVSVNNFDNLISAQFSINWDAQAMSYNSVSNITNALVDFGVSNVGTPTTSQGVIDGQLRVSWSPNMASDIENGVSIPDGTVLFSFLLNADGDPCDEVDLVLSNTPLTIEVADNNLNIVSAITTGANIIIEGPDCGDPGTGGGDGCPIVGNTSNLGLVAPEITAQNGDNVCIPITVNNWIDVQSAQTGIIWDETVLSFTGSQNYNLDGLNASSLNTANAANGEIRLIWFDNTGVNPSNLANGSTIIEICFDVIGANGSSSDFLFQEIQPNFNIEIGNSNGQLIPYYTDCGEVTVNNGGAGGPDGCAPSGDTNGVGVVTVEMSVTQGENICIPVSVDNFTDIQSAQFGMKWDPTLFSYTGTQSYNSSFTGLSANSFNPGNTSNGELRFIWFDNSGVSPVTLTDGSEIFEVCFDVIGDCDDFGDIAFQGFGSFSLEFSNSNGQSLPFYTDCGELSINCDGPATINLIVQEVVGNTGDEVCMNVSATNFIDVSSMQFNITWDETFLSYTNPNIKCLNPNMGIAVPNFNYIPNEKLRLSWSASSGGVTLNNGNEATMFCVCFDVVKCQTSGTTTSPVEIVGDSSVAIEIGNANSEEVPYILDQGSITVNASSSCDEITINIDSVTPANCFGELGSIDVTVTGSTSCQWVNTGTTTVVSNMCDLIAVAGSYTLIASDAAGNTATSGPVVISQPSEITASVESTDQTCEEKGTIILTPSGGTGSLTVTWTGSPSCANGCTGTTLSGLDEGVYTYTITDDNDCTKTDNVTINGSADTPKITVTKTDVTCTSLGSITLTSSINPVNVSWNPTETGTGLAVNNLPTGNYAYTVTDPSTGCSGSGSVDIVSTIEEFVVTETVNHIQCFEDGNGSVDFNIQGGCSNYSITVDFAGATIVGSSIQNLPPGTYNVSVLDSSEPANVVLKTITIAGPTSALSFVLDSKTASTGADDGTISTTVTGGTSPYTYNWTGGTCDSGCPDAGDITGLAPGLYFATVTDANDCTAVLKVTGVSIAGPGELVIESIEILSEKINNGFGVSCAGLTGNFCDGMIDATIEGSMISNLTISVLNNDSGVVGTYNSLPIDGLCAGNYTLSISDGNTTATEDFEITAPDPIEIELVNIVDEEPGAIDIEVTGGTGNYTYLWNAPLSDVTQDVSDLNTGTYSVIVSDDNDCTALSNNYVIGEVGGIPCFTSVPIITPNGDGINDMLLIQCSTNNPSKFSVYDRWGRLVYTQAVYTNNWAGQNTSGETLIEGAYYWVLEVAFNNGDSRLFKGTVTLLRE